MVGADAAGRGSAGHTRGHAARVAVGALNVDNRHTVERHFARVEVLARVSLSPRSSNCRSCPQRAGVHLGPRIPAVAPPPSDGGEPRRRVGGDRNAARDLIDTARTFAWPTLAWS